MHQRLQNDCVHECKPQRLSHWVTKRVFWYCMHKYRAKPVMFALTKSVLKNVIVADVTLKIHLDIIIIFLYGNSNNVTAYIEQ